MLTELCLLLVLHDCKAMAGGDSTQAAHAGKVTANIFQDVRARLSKLQNTVYNCTAGSAQDKETFEVRLRSENNVTIT